MPIDPFEYRQKERDNADKLLNDLRKKRLDFSGEQAERAAVDGYVNPAVRSAIRECDEADKAYSEIKFSILGRYSEEGLIVNDVDDQGNAVRRLKEVESMDVVVERHGDGTAVFKSIRFFVDGQPVFDNDGAFLGYKQEVALELTEGPEFEAAKAAFEKKERADKALNKEIEKLMPPDYKKLDAEAKESRRRETLDTIKLMEREEREPLPPNLPPPSEPQFALTRDFSPEALAKAGLRSGDEVAKSSTPTGMPGQFDKQPVGQSQGIDSRGLV